MTEGGTRPTLGLLPAGAALGPYTVEELLGSGGYSLVYRARDGRLGRHVALKVLAAGTVTQGQQQRFIEEARAAASLNHPNIATVYDVGIEGRECYIAMEYVEGESLRRRFRNRDARLPELLGLLRQTANAMAQAHARGIAHCDLKPENIMVTPEGAVKVLDFGLARLIARYKSTGERARKDLGAEAGTALETIEGTPEYMSPEQAGGHCDLDERSDVFSFGCILFEAAARRTPFAGDSLAETLHKVRHAPAPALGSFCPEAPGALCQIVARCLEKEPALRCSSMSEVEAALAGLLDPQGRRRLVSRRQWGAIAFCAALAAAAGAIGYVRSRPPAGVQSVAVIPLVNSGASDEISFVADGISEGIIHSLAQVPGLKVIARSSSFRFRSGHIDERQAARALGVRMLVLLSVAQAGGHLRVTVDLVDSRGTQVWGVQRSPGPAGLVGLESSISREIAQLIGAKLSELEIARMAAKVKPEAYELLLRGRYHARLYTSESRKKAVSYYEQAIAVEPGFALAHAELASVFRLMSGAGDVSAGETMPQAEAAARRALSADRDLAEAHAALADIKKDQWDWAAAENEYREALRLNPNLVSAYLGYAILLGVRQRHEAAIDRIRRAEELDPVGLPTAVHTAAVYYNARRLTEALAALKRALSLDPRSPAVWWWTGAVHGAARRYAESTKAFETAAALGDSSPAGRCYYAFSLARSGRRAEALAVLDGLQKSGTFVPPSAVAIVFVGLEQRGDAIRALRAAYEARDPMLQYLRVEAFFDDLADDPFFGDLTLKLGLPR